MPADSVTRFNWPNPSQCLNCQCGFRCTSRELNVLTRYNYFTCICFCIYIYLLDLRSSPTVLPSPLSHAVETRSPPSKAHYNANKSESYQVARSTNTFRRRSRTCSVLLVEEVGIEPTSNMPSL